jgi:hypothetical protein
MTLTGTAEVDAYLRDLGTRMLEILGENLAGLYLHGSSGQDVPRLEDRVSISAR